MFGLPTVYLKIAGFILLVGAMYGAYTYVTNLQDTVTNLTARNANLVENNDSLQTELEKQQYMKTVRDEVSEISAELRKNNQITKTTNEKDINESVKRGEDREVGSLLEGFFNE